MIGLSKKQMEVLEFIREFINTNGYSPSYREIGDHFSFSSIGTVYNHVKVLKKKGALKSEANSRRSFSVVKEEQNPSVQSTTELPFIGYIAAHEPIDTFPQVQTVTVPSTLVPSPHKTYAFRVRGDSLQTEFFVDGDLVLIEAMQNPNAGSIVLGILNPNHIFLKRYFPEGNYVRLESQSISAKPLIYRTEEVTVQGSVISLIRFY